MPRIGRAPVALLAALLLVVGALLAWRATAGRRAPAEPTVTHALVVQQVRDVARLVTSEVTLRDVVVYQDRRRFADRRALLVVTGRVTAGIALDSSRADGGGAEVRIDHEARRIRVSLPPAELTSVEVTDVRTYDERAGLLNPWRPADRDALQREVRARLARAGEESGLRERANRSAVALLERLLARDGYAVEVTVRGLAVVPRAG